MVSSDCLHFALVDLVTALHPAQARDPVAEGPLAMVHAGSRDQSTAPLAEVAALAVRSQPAGEGRVPSDVVVCMLQNQDSTTQQAQAALAWGARMSLKPKVSRWLPARSSGA